MTENENTEALRMRLDAMTKMIETARRRAKTAIVIGWVLLPIFLLSVIAWLWAWPLSDLDGGVMWAWFGTNAVLLVLAVLAFGAGAVSLKETNEGTLAALKAGEDSVNEAVARAEEVVAQRAAQDEV